jgi:lysine-specific demethylase/histidyl-hydroxylase NO66
MKRQTAGSAAPAAAAQQSKKNKSSASSSSSSSSSASSATSPLLSMADADVLPWLLAPVSVETFFASHWERAPLHIKRGDRAYFDGIFSKRHLDQCLRSRPLEWKYNINVCQFMGGVKVDQNLDADTPVDADYVQARFAKGSTLQALHPQQYTPAIWKLNSALESTFGSLVGSNVYLTPPKSQGLAPHCDDIEAWVLQLEGTKRWRLYRPTVECPRSHSGDLQYTDIGKPFMEIVLEPGDLLYFPRGLIHEACTQATEASTHLTVSTYQKTAWVDFMTAALQKACERAANADVDFRRGLPLQYLHFMGSGVRQSLESASSASSSSSSSASATAASDESTGALVTASFYAPAAAAIARARQTAFTATFDRLFDRLRAHIDLHEGADAVSADFMQNRLPPFAAESSSSSASAAAIAPVVATTASRVRLVEPTALRMMIERDEDGEMVVFLALSTENSHEYHMDGRFGRQPQIMKLPLACASAISHLFASHPAFVAVDALPMPSSGDSEAAAKANEDEDEEDEDLRVQLVEALLESKAIELESQ